MMKTINIAYPHTLLKEELPKTVAAIGFFDGIHKGHQAVIQTAINEAKERKMESAVITFHPHPSVILKENNPGVKYITPSLKKQQILQQLHVDRLYVITFNKQLASLSPEKFIQHFINGLHIEHLVAGFDFTFGHKGRGNMDNLSKVAKDTITYTKVNKVETSGKKVSSTKIRKLLSEGNVQEANKLLGRVLTCDGLVVHGEQRGRTIGYPTANLEVDQEILLPKPGIYAVKVNYKNVKYEALASLGTNPTFTPNSRELKLEVHLLDFDQQIYGEKVTIEWHKFIREEMKFSNVDQLIEEMNKDERKARIFFRSQ